MAFGTLFIFGVKKTLNLAASRRLVSRTRFVFVSPRLKLERRRMLPARGELA